MKKHYYKCQTCDQTIEAPPECNTNDCSWCQTPMALDRIEDDGKGGMSLDEAKAYLASLSVDRRLGLNDGDIARMQGMTGGLR